MSAEVQTQPTREAQLANRITMVLSFATFAIVWLSLIAGAFAKVWTLAEVRDLIILLVGLQAGSLVSGATNVVGKTITSVRSNNTVN